MKPGQPVSHTDASVLLRAVQRKLNRALTMREMPAAGRPVSQARRVQLQAAQMRLDEAEKQIAALAERRRDAEQRAAS